MNLCLLALLVLAVHCSDHAARADPHQGEDGHFVNEWAVEIPGGSDHAGAVAAQHGYTMVRPLKTLPDHYILTRTDTPHRSRRSANHHTRKLSEDERVTFVAQQQDKRRQKRGRVDRQIAREIVLRGEDPHDPELSHEWYLNVAGKGLERDNEDQPRTDLKVKDVWQKGITGKGVVVTILDDGLERTHPDLAANYDKEASTDLNDEDDDPMPRYDPTNENKHGTRCGGEIAMVANNGECGTGIAFDAKIGGVRMLDGRVTDRLEADAIAYNPLHIDIYSASWGPNDDGKTTEGPGRLVHKAFHVGITEGRNGKGVIYIWASGNGGRLGDNCNSDGYTSSIYTMSISSATQYGHIPWYSEKCSSTLTTTYSSGNSKEGKVTSADIRGKCTNAHSGTSAAAPMAAGIMALILEANPDLTWRDAQHIVAHTSRMEPLSAEKGWYKNGAGYCVNLAFGFGLMDALAAVELADPEIWKPVGEQKKCTVYPKDGTSFPQKLSSGHQVEIALSTDGCEGQDNEVNYLEHIQMVVDIDYSRRGHLYIELQSPSGTVTPLMLERKLDTSKRGFKQWALTSVHTWGEQPEGTWKLRVVDRSNSTSQGEVKGAHLVMYGTKEQPAYQKDSPKECGAPKKVQVDETSDDTANDKDLDEGAKLQGILASLSSQLENVEEKITTHEDSKPGVESNKSSKLKSKPTVESNSSFQINSKPSELQKLLSHLNFFH